VEDWGQVWQQMRLADPMWLVMLVLASWASYYIRAQRWRVLLRPVGDVPFYAALSATVIGIGSSAVLPLRLGEFIRPALLGRRTGISVSAALSSVVLERLFDMLTVVLFFLLVGFLYPLPPSLHRVAGVLSVLAAIGFGLLVVMQRYPAPAARIIDWTLGFLPARLVRLLRPVIDGFLDGLRGLSDARTIVIVLAYSIYLWAVITLSYTFALLAMHLKVPLVAASAATMVSVAIMVFLPQGPGFAGTWQLGCALALGLFGVPPNAVMGYSLLTWVMQMAINMTAAGFFLAREDLSPGALLRVERGASAAGAEG